MRKVTGHGRTVDRHERAETAAQVVELFGYLFIGHLDGVDRKLQTLVAGQVYLGADINLDREMQVS